MNKFLKMHDKGFGIPTNVGDYLESLGYHQNTPIAYGNGERGYRNHYRSLDGLYRTHIHISSSKVKVYKEYDCGGEIYHDEFTLPNHVFDNLQTFITIMGGIFEDISFE